MAYISGKARLDERGRLVLPADVRRALGLRAGDELRVSQEADGALRVESRQTAARALIGSAGRSDKGSVLDELRTERRRQAAAEDRDSQLRSTP